MPQNPSFKRKPQTAKQSANNFLSNKNLLAEIAKSKMSYCSMLDESFFTPHCYVDKLKEITPEKEAEVIEEWATKKLLTSRLTLQPGEVVFRLQTWEHIPEMPNGQKNGRKRIEPHKQPVSFLPFKQYILVDGKPSEVVRSHWIGGFDNGTFSNRHGKITHGLAKMLMLHVKRLASKGNWRGYSYNEELAGEALLQVTEKALLFDESKFDNPFAYYSQIENNAMKRYLTREKKMQNTRDDLLQEAGMMPSYSRQLDNERRQD